MQGESQCAEWKWTDILFLSKVAETSIYINKTKEAKQINKQKVAYIE